MNESIKKTNHQRTGLVFRTCPNPFCIKAADPKAYCGFQLSCSLPTLMAERPEYMTNQSLETLGHHRCAE